MSSNGNIFCIPGHCVGNSPVTVELICTWISSWVNNREAGDLRCHHAQYGATVMLYVQALICYFTTISDPFIHTSRKVICVTMVFICDVMEFARSVTSSLTKTMAVVSTKYQLVGSEIYTWNLHLNSHLIFPFSQWFKFHVKKGLKNGCLCSTLIVLFCSFRVNNANVKAVVQTIELPDIWDTVMLMWHH